MAFQLGKIQVGEVWEFYDKDGMSFIGRVVSQSQEAVTVWVMKAENKFLVEFKTGPGETAIIRKSQWSWRVPFV